jgi:exodeoxyribonuclease V
MVLTDGQREAIQKAFLWYYNDTDTKKIFVIAGVAGSGKSTVANLLVNILGLENFQVLYVAPTGKAASGLRMKGCAANTIHKTFYLIHKIDGKIVFSKKKAIPSMVKLIVIDELSMVNAKMMEDIISFGTPIIGLGDPCQIPPIYGENPYIKNYDVFLDQVKRQNGTSGILDLAQKARFGENIPLGIYKESKVITFADIHDIESYDIVICWKNSTRRELNKIIREKLGHRSIYPEKNEKILCLKNNYTHIIDTDNDIPIMLVNGLGLVSSNDAIVTDDCLNMEYYTDFAKDKPFNTRVSKVIFDNYKDMEATDIPDEYFVGLPEDIAILDFGYAVSCHKSQGAEWNNVLYIDEFKGSKDMYQRMLYTGITRAKQSITVARIY